MRKSIKSIRAKYSKSIESDIQKIGDKLKNSGLSMPGYGRIFQSKDGTRFWYVGADGDETGFSQLVEKELGSIDGIEEVIYESECFPPRRKEDWVQVYPKK